jgi:hypothetical protein
VDANHQRAGAGTTDQHGADLSARAPRSTMNPTNQEPINGPETLGVGALKVPCSRGAGCLAQGGFHLLPSGSNCAGRNWPPYHGQEPCPLGPTSQPHQALQIAFAPSSIHTLP